MVKIKFQAARLSASPSKRLLAIIGLVIFIAIFAANAEAFDRVRFTPLAQPDVFENVTLAGSFTEADARYMQTSLWWLREHLPEWYAYVAEGKPFIFAMDDELQTRRIISYAKCCYSRGAGAITFGEHLGHWNISEVASVPGMQAQQVQFLSVLIHEVTHIRERRDGRAEAVNWQTCIAAEQSANMKELEFARALTTVRIPGDANTRANYHRIVDQHLEITQEDLDGVSWKIFCILTFTDDNGQ
ncbi:MAG: hypothetical protein HY868_11680 [Chloroflexi bacterium]|nr:hypothetical protein [Chloroflexota bacterium]